jgi:hypothetical protein
LNGKTDTAQWKKNTWLEWASSGKTVAKNILKLNNFSALKRHRVEWSWNGRETKKPL